MYKVYILHGWAYSTEKWAPFLKLLEHDKISFEMLKIPGLTTPLDEVWNLSNYVEWLEKKTKSQEQIVLLGHSNGGRIALAFTLKNPKKVSKLILIDSAGIYHNEMAIRMKRLIFKKLSSFKKIAYNSLLKNALYKFTREADYNKATPVMKKTMQNLIESDLSSKISDVKVPTTIIWGENDTTTQLSDGKVMNKEIMDSKIFIIKGARHSPQFTNPEEVFEIINSELK